VPGESGRARIDERLGVALEQETVGRDRQILDAVGRGQHRDQCREVTPHEWLAPGQPHRSHAHRREQADQPLDLLKAHHSVAFEPGQALRRHAVLAAEVASIGDRYTHILDQPPMPIGEGLHGHRQSVTCPFAAP
jgi:hypothetical protein